MISKRATPKLTLRVKKEAWLLTHQTLRKPAASAVGLQNAHVCAGGSRFCKPNALASGGAANQSTITRPAASAVGLLTLRVKKEAWLQTHQTLRRPAASAVGLLTLRVKTAEQRATSKSVSEGWCASGWSLRAFKDTYRNAIVLEVDQVNLAVPVRLVDPPRKLVTRMPLRFAQEPSACCGQMLFCAFRQLGK